MASSLEIVNTVARVPVLRSTIVRAQTDSESSPSQSEAGAPSPPPPSRTRYSDLHNHGKWNTEEEEEEEEAAAAKEAAEEEAEDEAFLAPLVEKQQQQPQQLEKNSPVEIATNAATAVAEEVSIPDHDDAWMMMMRRKKMPVAAAGGAPETTPTTTRELSRGRVRVYKEWERHGDDDHRERDRDREKVLLFRESSRDEELHTGRSVARNKENDGLHHHQHISSSRNHLDGFSSRSSMDVAAVVNGVLPRSSSSRDVDGNLPRSNTENEGYNGTRGGGNDFERERGGGFYRDGEKQRSDGQLRDRDNRGRDDQGSRAAADHHHVRQDGDHYFSSRPLGGHERKDSAGDVGMQSSYSSRRDRDIDRDRRGGGGQQGPDDRDENVAGGGGQTGSRPWQHDDGEYGGDLWKSRDTDIDRRLVQKGRDRGGGGGGQDLPIAPALNSIHRATVHSIRPFGIFVRFDGYRNHGLVHLSQVSDHEVTKKEDSEEAKVQALASIAGEGDQVWVKVISVKVEEDRSTKVACSLKYVNQGNGQDLDPNNVQLEQKMSRPPWREPQKLKLEAIYNVQCTRCGGHGHLKKECYSSGDKMYELLPEEEDLDNNRIRSPTRGKGPMQKETQAPPVQQPSKLQAGISSQLLSSGSVGRGRAMVQPAWMKHGIGVGGPVPTQQQPASDDNPKARTSLPDKVTTVQEAVAVIARLKEEKSRRREERHRRKEKRQSHRDAKKEKHRKRHRDEEEEEEAFAEKEHYSNRKMHHHHK